MPIETTKTRIYNVLAMKDAAKAGMEDWLSKAKELKEIAVSKTPQGGTYEKLPSLKLKLLNGTADEPQILVVKAITSPHESNTEERTLVFEAEVLFSESKDINEGKYNIWYGYKVFNDEMEKYVSQYGNNGNIDGQTFVIASVGESVPKKRGNKPAKLFRIFPPP